MQFLHFGLAFYRSKHLNLQFDTKFWAYGSACFKRCGGKISIWSL